MANKSDVSREQYWKAVRELESIIKDNKPHHIAMTIFDLAYDYGAEISEDSIKEDFKKCLKRYPDTKLN